MTPTGTNLLGLVKHVASAEAGYFGVVFGRPFGEPLPCYEEGAEPKADMWATADESRQQIVGLYAHGPGQPTRRDEPENRAGAYERVRPPIEFAEPGRRGRRARGTTIEEIRQPRGSH